jgi:hypothetical protein
VIKLLSVFILILPLLSQAEIDWRGHNRLISSQVWGAFTDENEKSLEQYILNHRSIVLFDRDAFSFEAAYELFAQRNQYLNPLLSQDLSQSRFRYRVEDLNYLMVNERSENSSSVIIQNLDRFLLTYSDEELEVNVGRQAISFGSARVMNPLDILVPFDFVMVNIEQRLGVDATRVKYSFSEMGIIDFGMVFERDRSGSDQFKFFSVRETLGRFDIRLILQEVEDIKLSGLDIQTDFMGWGVWLEAAELQSDSIDPTMRATLGGQYHFTNDIDFYLEYHHNGLDESNANLGIFTEDKSYFNWGGSYLLTPLQSFSLNFIQNMHDSSVLISSAYQYNFAQDWYADIGVFLGLGSDESEFDNYPKTLYGALKSFF